MRPDSSGAGGPAGLLDGADIGQDRVRPNARHGHEKPASGAPLHLGADRLIEGNDLLTWLRSRHKHRQYDRRDIWPVRNKSFYALGEWLASHAARPQPEGLQDASNMVGDPRHHSDKL